MFGYDINWTAVGICLTAIIAVWQLRVDGHQKRESRELETKRNILFDGVRGMSLAHQSLSNLPNMEVKLSDSLSMFQVGMSLITVATSVASLNSAKAGKEFTDKLGPIYLNAMRLRGELERLPNGIDDAQFADKHRALVGYVLDNTVELVKSMLRAIAAVRADVGIAKESKLRFLEVIYPDDALINSVIAKTLGRDVSK